MNHLIKVVSEEKKAASSILNDKFVKEKMKLLSVYKAMDVDFSSEMLSIMNEVIDYCALYIVFKNLLPLDIIEKIILTDYDEMMKEYSDNDWMKINMEMFSEKNIQEIREAALNSQKSKFTEDYLVYFVEGDGTFLFGNNTLRCPIHLFCKKAGILEFLETLCSVDYIRSKYMKSGLVREKCLCHPEDEMCTFRWKNMI